LYVASHAALPRVTQFGPAAATSTLIQVNAGFAVGAMI